MVWWWAAAALAGKWDNQPADVVVTKVVPKPQAELQAALGDWKGWERVLPCASEWVLQARTTGVDARAEALYRIGPLRRRLVGVIRKDTPGLVVELETEGKKGWFTQVTFGDAPAGSTEVTLRTPLTAPKWPVTGVFHQKVKPAWEACYAEALGRL
jgi:hypothetical protein